MKHGDDISKLDAHYRDVCKAILLKDGVVVKDLSALAILQEYRRIWAKEDAIRQGKRARAAGSASPARAPSDHSPDANDEYFKQDPYMATLQDTT